MPRLAGVCSVFTLAGALPPSDAAIFLWHVVFVDRKSRLRSVESTEETAGDASALIAQWLPHNPLLLDFVLSCLILPPSRAGLDLEEGDIRDNRVAGVIEPLMSKVCCVSNKGGI